MRVGRAVCFLGLASITLAAADAPRPLAPAETEDTIAKARRDLDAIKAMRGVAAEAQRAELPHLNVPDVNLGGGIGVRPNAVAPNAKAKTANWLVESMVKKTDKLAGPKDNSDVQAENNENSLGISSDATERPVRGSAGEPLRRDRFEERALSANPLTSYMAGWMTPGDYKLLKPALQIADGLGAFVPSTDDRGPLIQSDFLGSAAIERAASPMVAAKTTGGQAENPFLQAQASLPNTPSAPVPVVIPGAAPTVAKPSAAPSLPTPQLAAPRQPPASRPDFLKNGDEAKYFKPLKKF